MAGFEAGQVVIADWRDALPREVNKLRPAMVVEVGTLFGPLNPDVILVPLTEDASMVVPELSVRIDPTPENGCTKVCFAVSPLMVGISKLRVRPTPSRITAEQLARIRRQIADSIGLE